MSLILFLLPSLELISQSLCLISYFRFFATSIFAIVLSPLHLPFSFLRVTLSPHQLFFLFSLSYSSPLFSIIHSNFSTSLLCFFLSLHLHSAPNYFPYSHFWTISSSHISLLFSYVFSYFPSTPTLSHPNHCFNLSSLLPLLPLLPLTIILFPFRFILLVAFIFSPISLISLSLCPFFPQTL